MPRPFLTPIACSVLFVAFSALAQSGAMSVEIERPWVRLMKTDGTVTAYFTILNPSPEPDRLLQVMTQAAGEAKLYSSDWRGLLGFAAEQTEAIDVGGYTRVQLRPGGYHIRLERPTRPIGVGDVIPLTLVFERSGLIEIEPRVANRLLGPR